VTSSASSCHDGRVNWRAVRSILVALGVLTGAGLASDAAETEREWKAAAAVADITPQGAFWMGGYAARRGPSEGVLGTIHAKALVLEDAEGSRLAILTYDLIGIPRTMRDRVAERVASTWGIASDRLLLNASHTHCGPMIRVYRPPWGGEPRAVYDRIPDDEETEWVERTIAYRDFLVEASVELVGEALTRMEPATLSWSRARCGFSMNRRTPLGPGQWRNAPNPDGPVDQEVPVLRIRGEGDELRAVLFGYACHATTLSVMEINGDWPGRAQSLFEKEHPGTIALFLNGASGDQNPYPRRLRVYLERHGQSMVTSIEAAIETEGRPVTGPLRAAISWCPVRYRHPTREELEEKARSPDRYDARHARFLLEWWDEQGELARDYAVPVQVIRFGESLTLVALGGEVVVDYAHRVRNEIGEKSGGSPVWFAGYSNDVMGYIPSERVLSEGGYEGKVAMRYVRSTVHPGPWAPGIESRLMESVHRLYDSLDAKKRTEK